MKGLYTLLLTFGILESANAQITLTASSHTPQVGQVENIYTHEIDNTDTEYDFYELDGENQIWNFFNLWSESEDNEQIQYLSSFSGPEYIHIELPYFPNYKYNMYREVIISDQESIMVTSQHKGNDDYYFYGRFDMLRFPMNYGDDYSDDISGYVIHNSSEGWEVGDEFEGGLVTVTADAYGDLILPHGQINNVLRVKTVIEYIEKEIRYDWYHAGSNIPVASCRKRGDENNTSDWVAYFIDEFRIQSLDINEKDMMSAYLYPNPASYYINIPDFINSYKIYDISGAIVKDTRLVNLQLDVSKLKSGIYFIEYVTNNYWYRKKFVIQH